MDRTKTKDLDAWYSNPDRKPLIIWGARQVGKTYLVKELFAKKFRDYIYIDLNKDDDARAFFGTTCDADKYIAYIEGRYRKKVSRDTPLIFDEVQSCPPVIASLKYFCQDHREIPVIATGSMVRLSIREHAGSADGFVFPVGKINEMELFPLTFEEYLMNSNGILLERIRDAYRNRIPLKDFEHDLAMDQLYEYLSVGGLPEPVDGFLKNRSYADARARLDSVYGNYISDMDTYNTSKETILKTMNVYRNIFGQLNKENRNFKVSQIDRGKYNRDYFDAYRWLELSGVVYRSGNLSGKVTLPITAENPGLFRLYLSDPGIFAFQSDVLQSDFFAKDRRNTLSGIFYENYVADELAAKGVGLFYWTGKKTNEFEFIVRSGSGIAAIDVKKRRGTMNSLDAFRQDNPNSLAVKISANNYGYDKEKDILTIPLYEAFLVADDVASGRDLRPE